MDFITIAHRSVFGERGQGQKRRREPRSTTPSPSPKISRPSSRSSVPKTPVKRASTAERLMELASGSGSESSRSSVKDRSGYRSGHNEDVLSKLLPGAAPGNELGWTDRGIMTSKKPVGGFKKPNQKQSGKTRTKPRHLEPQYSSSKTAARPSTLARPRK